MFCLCLTKIQFCVLYKFFRKIIFSFHTMFYPEKFRYYILSI